MKVRGFEIAKGWEDRDIELPRRSTTNAAGYDIAAAEDITVPVFHPGIQPTLIPTGLKAYCRPDECYLIFNRSSGAGKGIVTANGVGLIDADYYENPTNDGHFYIIVFNVSDHELHIKKGDRVAQIIFQKFLTADIDQPGGERQGGFGSTDSAERKLRIVYDLDDVLWELTQFVMQKLQLDRKIQTDFRLDQDPAFTDAERAALTAAFSDADNFERIRFYPGASEILAIAAPDVDVMINSNAYSPAVVAVKRRRLQEFYPNMPVELQHINLVTPATNRKQIDPDVLVFIDDSPYAIAGSKAKFNLMPHKTWNTTSAARQIATSEDKALVQSWRQSLPQFLTTSQNYVIPVKDLREANEFVQQVVNLIKGEQNGS